MQYYELINGMPVPAKLPLRVQENGVIREIYNPTQEEAANAGWYIKEETEPPTYNPSYQTLSKTYKIVDGVIRSTYRRNTRDIDEVKAERIALSKANLAAYLESNPLMSACHGGEVKAYTATEEKQNQFVRKFTAHMTKVNAGIEDTMMWNSAGGMCEPWTDEECLAFIVEMDAYVTPLVEKQQAAEILIRNASTAKEAAEVDISFP